jgi:hypothetical protein
VKAGCFEPFVSELFRLAAAPGCVTRVHMLAALSHLADPFLGVCKDTYLRQDTYLCCSLLDDLVTVSLPLAPAATRHNAASSQLEVLLLVKLALQDNLVDLGRVLHSTALHDMQLSFICAGLNSCCSQTCSVILMRAVETAGNVVLHASSLVILPAIMLPAHQLQ